MYYSQPLNSQMFETMQKRIITTGFSYLGEVR